MVRSLLALAETAHEHQSVSSFLSQVMEDVRVCKWLADAFPDSWQSRVDILQLVCFHSDDLLAQHNVSQGSGGSMIDRVGRLLDLSATGVDIITDCCGPEWCLLSTVHSAKVS